MGHTDARRCRGEPAGHTRGHVGARCASCSIPVSLNCSKVRSPACMIQPSLRWTLHVAVIAALWGSRPVNSPFESAQLLSGAFGGCAATAVRVRHCHYGSRPAPPGLPTRHPLAVSVIHLFQVFPLSGILRECLLCDWLPSLSTAFSGLKHVTPWISTSFLKAAGCRAALD